MTDAATILCVTRHRYPSDKIPCAACVAEVLKAVEAAEGHTEDCAVVLYGRREPCTCRDLSAYDDARYDEERADAAIFDQSLHSMNERMRRR